MTTVTIDDTSPGQVIPGPGTLDQIIVASFPAQGFEPPQYAPGSGIPRLGALCLAETSGPNPRQLYSALGNDIGVLASLGRPPGVGNVILSAPIPFTSLLVAAVPRGASFVLTTTP
jgi:hypothetical protein